MILNKGLTFIPSVCKSHHRNTKDQAKLDLQEYHRRLKLAAYYEGKPDSVYLPFLSKSTWLPSTAQLPPEITKLTELDNQTFQEHHRVGWIKSNLSKFEIEALNQLKNNTSIVIKPADKGSSVVIMDREDYISEGYRQLFDKKYYVKLEKPIYKETVPMIEKIVTALYNKKFINNKQKTYLLGSKEPRIRRFYTLPKIHKKTETWTVPHRIPPGRPIVSDCDSESYYTAEFIEHYLNPLAKLHSSYLKDTYFFIDKVKKIKINPTAFIFSLDVESLYTNISTSEGIAAVKQIFQKHPNSKRPEKEILQLLEINLNRNDFEFNNQYFLQISGTAMGKRFAPQYADIFMAHWEEGALATCQKKPTHYFRYLDDIWGIWDHSEEDFFKFLETLNNHSRSIKLKATLSQTSIDFLDTTTYKGPDFLQHHQLDIKVFFKETDTHSLLFRTSYHPKHTFAGLVKSQLIRFKRICTRQDDFKEAVKTLFSSLTTRGYSYTMLRRSLRTFTQIKPISLDPVLPIIMTYSTANCDFAKRLKRNFACSGGNNIFLKDHKLISAFRRNQNLGDILVKAKLKTLATARTKTLTEFFRTYKFVRNQHNKEVFKTQSNNTPHTKNCIYLIRCAQCSTQYVGETGNSLLTRFTQHRYNINRHKNTHTYLVKHFMEHGWPNLRATILEANPNWTLKQRRKTERNWITKLNTIFPYGLNER